MLKKMLEMEYGVQVDDYIKLDSYEALRGNGWIYLISRPGQTRKRKFLSWNKLPDICEIYGDSQVPVFLPSKEGKFLTKWGEKTATIAFLLYSRQQDSHHQNWGENWHDFMNEGRMIPFQIQRSSRVGKWKELWEKRLEQMEKVWNGLLFQTPEDDFERMFIDPILIIWV